MLVFSTVGWCSLLGGIRVYWNAPRNTFRFITLYLIIAASVSGGLQFKVIASLAVELALRSRQASGTITKLKIRLENAFQPANTEYGPLCHSLATSNLLQWLSILSRQNVYFHTRAILAILIRKLNECTSATYSHIWASLRRLSKSNCPGQRMSLPPRGSSTVCYVIGPLL